MKNKFHDFLAVVAAWAFILTQVIAVSLIYFIGFLAAFCIMVSYTLLPLVFWTFSLMLAGWLFPALDTLTPYPLHYWGFAIGFVVVSSRILVANIRRSLS